LALLDLSGECLQYRARFALRAVVLSGEEHPGK
jgi:hypothetical protein